MRAMFPFHGTAHCPGHSVSGSPSTTRRMSAGFGLHLPSFEIATRQAGHGWRLCDLTDVFAHWMAQQEYRETYIESPEDLPSPHPDFERSVAARLRGDLKGSAESTVVAVAGVASLFGFMKVSKLMEMVESSIEGRLMVFFPGEYEDNTYRLLDARDGWNYHAVPITAAGGLETT